MEEKSTQYDTTSDNLSSAPNDNVSWLKQLEKYPEKRKSRKVEEWIICKKELKFFNQFKKKNIPLRVRFKI